MGLQVEDAFLDGRGGDMRMRMRMRLRMRLKTRMRRYEDENEDEIGSSWDGCLRMIPCN